MGVCEVCGNEYANSFEVVTQDGRHTFDSFECAISMLAPRCGQCDCRVIGHGVEVEGEVFCCAHCARMAGMPGTTDHVDSPTEGQMSA